MVDGWLLSVCVCGEKNEKFSGVVGCELFLLLLLLLLLMFGVFVGNSSHTCFLWCCWAETVGKGHLSELCNNAVSLLVGKLVSPNQNEPGNVSLRTAGNEVVFCNVRCELLLCNTVCGKLICNSIDTIEYKIME